MTRTATTGDFIAHSPIYVQTSFASCDLGPEHPGNRAILLGVLRQPSERVLMWHCRHSPDPERTSYGSFFSVGGPDEDTG